MELPPDFIGLRIRLKRLASPVPQPAVSPTLARTPARVLVFRKDQRHARNHLVATRSASRSDYRSLSLPRHLRRALASANAGLPRSARLWPNPGGAEPMGIAMTALTQPRHILPNAASDR